MGAICRTLTARLVARSGDTSAGSDAQSHASSTVVGRLRHGQGTPRRADYLHFLAHDAGTHDGGADAVKLPFVTVELERVKRGHDLVGFRGPPGPSLRERLHSRVVAGIAAAICVSAATVAGCSIGGGGPALATDPLSWLPMSLGASTSGPGTVQLDITSTPAGASVLVDGHEKGKTPLTVVVGKGPHALRLTHPSAVDDQRHLDISNDMHVNVTMFERRPRRGAAQAGLPGGKHQCRDVSRRWSCGTRDGTSWPGR
jgi:hypothetical protein